MTTLEIILSALTPLLAGSNVVQMWVTRKKNAAEAAKSSDAVLYDRIEFLDRRITNLENKACFRNDCEKRI